MMKLALMRTAPGKEDPELHLLQRISSLELPGSEIAASINASQSSSTKLLLKDTNRKKRLAWAKKHKQWTLDWCKSVLWTMTQQSSRLCKGYFTKKESDGELYQMTWPPQSPNLNPILMVWDEMECKVKEKAANKSSTYVLRLLEKHSK
jgi:hypothetical protein